MPHTVVSIVVCNESVVTMAAASESDAAIETLQLIQGEHADVIGDAGCL